MPCRSRVVPIGAVPPRVTVIEAVLMVRAAGATPPSATVATLAVVTGAGLGTPSRADPTAAPLTAARPVGVGSGCLLGRPRAGTGSRVSTGPATATTAVGGTAAAATATGGLHRAPAGACLGHTSRISPTWRFRGARATRTPPVARGYYPTPRLP